METIIYPLLDHMVRLSDWVVLSFVKLSDIFP